MERKFYPENFEKFLRGHANHFKMIPSKKVWHGIYNDLHPGRRWPSLAVSMVFIFTLVVIGHLNTNNGYKTPLYNVTSIGNTKLSKAKKPSTIIKIANARYSNRNNNANQNIADSVIANQELNIIKNSQPVSNTIADMPNIEVSKANNAVFENKKENILSDKIENNVLIASGNNSNSNEPSNLSKNEEDANSKASTNVILSNSNKEISTSVKKATSDVQAQTNATSINKRKKNNSALWTYYITPSVSYRYLSDNRMNNAVTQRPMLGYEGGIEMSFNILKNLKFSTGLQLNYSGYNIHANSTHPIVSSIVLNNTAQGQYNVFSTVSHYGNGTGTEISRLKNYSLQTALPVGLQYMFAVNNNIKFSAVAAFQPTLIIASRAYMLSNDKKNYLTAPDLLRNWNMNTNLATYVSIASNSYTWQIGPQVRYQLLSTYSKSFPVKEHLINYGFRIGISKNSK